MALLRAGQMIIDADAVAGDRPEVIVRVTSAGTPLIGVYVYVVPQGGQSTNPLGVMTDRNGTAWFVLKEPGKYVAVCDVDGQAGSVRFRAKHGKTYARPGYRHIRWVSLEI